MECNDGATLDSINNLVSWYQQKIAAYDKQLWEKSVEQRVLKHWKGINKVPRKSARVRPELIDVDLVRGSTFTKEKPQYSWLAVSSNGILRVLFLPLYIKWWSRVTSWWFSLGLLVLYSLQVAASVAYNIESDELVSKNKSSDLLSSVHIIVPWCMMLLLGVLQSHISATRTTQKSSKASSCHKICKEKRDSSTKTFRRKSTSRTKNRDSGLQENGVNESEEMLLAEGLSKISQLGTNGTQCKHRVKRRSGSPSSARSMAKSHNGKYSKIKENFPLLSTNSANGLSNLGKSHHSIDSVVSRSRRSSEGELSRSSRSSRTPSVKENAEECPIFKAEGFSQPTPHVRITQSEGFQVIKGANGLDEESSSSNESIDEGMLCGNSQEDPASLDKPLPESVGTIIIPASEETSLITDNSKQLPVNHLTTIEVPKRQFTSRINGKQPNENESPSEAGSSEHSQQGSNGSNGASLIRGSKKDTNFMSSCESDVDTAPNTPLINKKPVFLKTRLARGFPPQMHGNRNSMETECGQTSEMEWEENAMNSEVSSSDSSNCESPATDTVDDLEGSRSGDLQFNHHIHNIPSVLNNLASNSDKVSCMIWEEEEVKKVDLTVLELGWTIIQNVDQVPRVCDYLYFGFFVAVLDTVMPLLFRIYHTKDALSQNLTGSSLVSLENLFLTASTLFGTNGRVLLIVINSMVQRLTLSLIFFFLLSVAEKTFKQRLLYAKHFCYLTSSRRARKYQLPHFRLNKVRNIKTWLSLRSYLKKRGPQRSVDMIVSAAFLTAVALMSLMSVELLNDSTSFLDHIGNWELILWCFVLALYLLRFMTLGTKINKKYRNFSVLITEQINLYLHMELKPHKKDELMRANSVLKLAEDLLKELESPFKISGLSANPILYNVTKVVILSAFSAILTELLGFKLKLYKIKFRG